MNFDQAVIDKISNLPEIAPNFTYFQKSYFKISLEKDRETASTLLILWQGHVRNLLFHFCHLCSVNSYTVIQIGREDKTVDEKKIPFDCTCFQEFVKYFSVETDFVGKKLLGSQVVKKK